MESSKLYEFLSKRSVATLSVVATSIIAIYLSTVDNKISNGNYGVFSLQLAFTSENFLKIFGTISAAGKDLLRHYLQFDIIFSVCCAFTLPSVLSLMFSQYKLVLEESFNQTPARIFSKLLALSFYLSPLIAVLTIIGNFIILSMIRTTDISQSMVLASSLSHAGKFSVLFSILAFLISLLVVRRQVIRSAYRHIR
jgi:hypothetical protein